MKRTSGFRPAATADVETLLDLAKAFYGEEGYPFKRAAARAALIELLRNPAQGWVWVVRHRSKTVGYLVVTLGFSLEYRGRTAFVDEIYLSPEHRGRGLGSKALALAERTAARAGARAVHLEVEWSNTRAHALYYRRGFADRGRYLLTKQLGESRPLRAPARKRRPRGNLA